MDENNLTLFPLLEGGYPKSETTGESEKGKELILSISVFKARRSNKFSLTTLSLNPLGLLTP